jgi:hypothetical protein
VSSFGSQLFIDAVMNTRANKITPLHSISSSMAWWDIQFFGSIGCQINPSKLVPVTPISLKTRAGVPEQDCESIVA